MEKKEGQIILGIDPGTKVAGYGLIKTSSKIQLLDYGCIRPPASLKLEKRYLILFDSFSSLIEKYKPHAVAIENQFVNKNIQSAMKLSMAKVSIMLAAAKQDITVYEYAPRKAKLAVVGSGGASKEQVQKMVQVLLNLQSPPKPQDASDALAIAICHAHNCKTLSFLNRVNHV